MPKVSVVIPCYNQGNYVDEAVESVLNQSYRDFEIVIVNDGSSDSVTEQVLANYDLPEIRVIHTQNQGLASARNSGIREAMGEYILPLDADDKIGREYLEKSVSILDACQDIGIVYCEAAYFGFDNALWPLPECTTEKMLTANLVFCTALFRKSEWEKAGGYNINMVYGWEDWDFWLSLIALGKKIYRIPQVLFYYRVNEVTMVRQMTPEKQFFMKLHAWVNHRNLYRLSGEIRIFPKVAQLRIDSGSGYSDHQLITQTVFGDEKVLEFDLSGFKGVQAFRFDPVNDFAVVRISSVQIVNAYGALLDLTYRGTNAFYRIGSSLLFNTKDPRIYFRHDGSKIQKLMIRLEYVAIGKDSFDYLLKIQGEIISDLEKQIECSLYFRKVAESIWSFKQLLSYRMAFFFRQPYCTKIEEIFRRFRKGIFILRNEGLLQLIHHVRRRRKHWGG